MPKAKTCKAAAKRFRKTSKGKYKFFRANAGHLMAGKSRKRKRHLKKRAVLNAAEVRRMNTMLPG